MVLLDGLGELLTGGLGVGEQDVQGRIVDVDIQAFGRPFGRVGGVPLGQVSLGEGLAHREVIGVVGREHRQVVQELGRLLLAEVDPRQVRDPLGVIGVVLPASS